MTRWSYMQQPHVRVVFVCPVWFPFFQENKIIIFQKKFSYFIFFTLFFTSLCLYNVYNPISIQKHMTLPRKKEKSIVYCILISDAKLFAYRVTTIMLCLTCVIWKSCIVFSSSFLVLFHSSDMSTMQQPKQFMLHVARKEYLFHLLIHW